MSRFWRRSNAILMLTLLFLAAGCAKPAPTPAPAQAVKTVRLVQAGPNKVMESIIGAYMEAHPDIRLEVLYLPEDPMVDWTAWLKDKIDKGDVDVVPVIYAEEMVRQKLLLALDPYVKAGHYDLKPYGPGLDQLRYDGVLYELPVNLVAHLVVYNRDMFRAAGVPEPTAGWTWEQFREAAGRLTHGDGADKVWGFAPAHPFQTVVARVFQPTEGTRVPDPAGVREALQLFATMTFQDHSMPAYLPLGPGFEADDNLFADGTTAMSLETPGFLRVGAPGFKFQYGVAPLPTLPGIAPSIEVDPTTYGIAATARDPQAAWDLLTFLTGAEGALISAKAGDLPGYSSDEIRRAWFERKPTPDPGTVFLFESPWSLPQQFNSTSRGKAYQLLKTAVNQTLSGQRTYEQAAADYAVGYEQIMAQR